MASTSGSVVGVGRPKTKEHPIYEYFTKVGLGKSEVSCNVCSTKLKAQYGNTTSIRRHLERKHYPKYVEFLKKDQEHKKSKEKECHTQQPKQSQPTIKDFVQTKECYGPKHPKAIAINNSIGMWMADSLHPFSLAAQRGLKKTLKLADERIQLPCVNTFKRKIVPKIAVNKKNELKSLIDDEKKTLNSLSVTTDMWTSLAVQSFIAVTIQFVKKDFTLFTWCLACERVFKSHTGANIAEHLNKIMNSWGLTKDNIPNLEIFCITDNAANMRTAISLTEMTHLTCFAHNLNLMVKDAKRESPGFENLVAKCKTIVGHFRHSAPAKEALTNRLKEIGQKPLELIQSVETRWNSEYLMMSRLLEIKDGLILELSKAGCKVDCLTSSEWGLVESYVEILQPIYEATVTVSSACSPTRSMVIPILHGLESKMAKLIEEKKPGITVARAVAKALKARFPIFKEVQPDQCCMVLDPRFKDHILPEHSKKSVIEKIKKEISMFENLQASVGIEDIRQTPNKPSTSSALFAAFDEEERSTASTSENSSLKGAVELQAYLEEPRMKSNNDPFVWWQNNFYRYPLLGRLARKYLGIAATEVASERVFSTAGNVLTRKRSRLSGENADKLVFLHENLNDADFDI